MWVDHDQYSGLRHKVSKLLLIDQVSRCPHGVVRQVSANGDIREFTCKYEIGGSDENDS